MSDDYSFDIPEMNRIDSMMDDLLGDDDTTVRPTKSANGRIKRILHGNSQPNRLYGSSFSYFAEHVNWSNAETFRSPFTQIKKTSRRLGGLTLQAFGSMTNWTNDINALPPTEFASTSIAASPETLESFFDGFGND